MRRFLLGGLGIALGAFIRPASAQDFPRPTPIDHPNSTSPANRGATLGVPVAVPDASPSGVTPAGLLDRRPFASAPATVPPPSTQPMPSATVGVPTVYAAPPVGAGGTPLPLAAPRTLGSPPNLTEIRGPVSGGVPVVPGTTFGVPSGVTVVPGTTFNVPSGVPIVGMGESFVPTLAPQDCPVEVGVPMAGVATGFPALGRLAGCGNPRWWASGEYLLWWTRSTQLPTLVTTSSPASNGILGNGDTVPVVGGSFGQTLHGGARFSTGWWFSDEQFRGVDARFMFLFRNGNDMAVNTNTFPVLARPFIHANSPVGPFSEVVGAPGLAMGGVVTHLDNSLWGAEVNYRRYLRGNGCFRLDGLVGFRYLNFSENLSVTESFVRTADSPMSIGAPALSGTISDTFRATNNFYGGQVGLTGEVRRGKWFVNGRSSIAFGTVHQTATVAGGQALVFGPGQVGQFQGGLLALPGANSGTFTQDKFAVLPELGLNLGYHVTPHLRVFVGYNFLYLSNVLRASGTVDPVVDAARIPNFPLAGNPVPLSGVAAPAPQFRTTDFWAQGINFGLQWTW